LVGLGNVAKFGGLLKSEKWLKRRRRKRKKSE